MSCEHNTAMRCPCTYSCKNQGKCCACIAQHIKLGNLPVCLAEIAKERPE